MPSAFPAYWILRDDQGQWTWKFAQTDGDFAAASSRGYASRQECAQAIKQLKGATSVAVFSTLEDMEPDAPPAKKPSKAEPAAEPLELSTSQRLQEDRATRSPEGAKNFVGPFDSRAQFLSTASRTANAGAAKKAV